jgi:membrane protein required for colicin V production
MVWVDIAIIALLAIYSIVGIIRGYSQEMYSLIAWLIGMIIAWFFSQDFAILLLEVFASPATRLAASFIALILITLLVAGVINMLLAGSVKKIGLTFLDRLGGLALGFGHGVVVAFVLVVVAGLTSLPKDRWWQESKYLPPFQSVAILIKENISSKLANSINYR